MSAWPTEGSARRRLPKQQRDRLNQSKEATPIEATQRQSFQRVRESTNARRAALVSSGRSTIARCPASGSIRASAPGTRSARKAGEPSGASGRSCSPVRARSGRASPSTRPVTSKASQARKSAIVCASPTQSISATQPSTSVAVRVGEEHWYQRHARRPRSRFSRLSKRAGDAEFCTRSRANTTAPMRGFLRNPASSATAPPIELLAQDRGLRFARASSSRSKASAYAAMAQPRRRPPEFRDRASRSHTNSVNAAVCAAKTELVQPEP